MKTQSAKAKGRRLQQLVVQKLLAAFEHLTELDLRSCSMGASGEDVVMSQAAKDTLPYSFECKSQKQGFTPVYKAYEQALSQNAGEPIVVIKQDRKKPH
jgi:hypothetical protein